MKNLNTNTAYKNVKIDIYLNILMFINKIIVKPVK